MAADRRAVLCVVCGHTAFLCVVCGHTAFQGGARREGKPRVALGGGMQGGGAKRIGLPEAV